MDDVNTQLKQARERLAAFEEASSRDFLLDRLRAQSPMHPFIVGRNLVALGSLALVGMAVLSMVIPLLSRDYAVQMMDLQAAIGFPLPVAFLVLALCGFAMVAAMHQLALGAARSAPLLPAEAKKHQRLVADVKQLESKLALEGTPRPVARITH